TRLKRRDRVVRVLTPPLPGPSFRAAVRDVLDDYRRNRKRSLLDVERHVRLHLGPFIGRRRLAAITTADIRRYVLRRQEEGARNATINRELSVLKRAFTLAIAAGTLASRPHIALLREDNVRRGFFETEDFEAVRRRLSPDLADFVSFLYTTGWRWRSEAARLRWTNIAFDAAEVRLEPGPTKTGDGRVLPFTADLPAPRGRRRAGPAASRCSPARAASAIPHAPEPTDRPPLPKPVEMNQRRVSTRQGIGRCPQIRIPHRHLEKKARVKERLQDRPCHARPFRVDLRLETLPGARVHDLPEPWVQRPVGCEAREHPDDRLGLLLKL